MYDSIVAVTGVTAVRDLARLFAEDKQSQGCASYGMLGWGTKPHGRGFILALSGWPTTRERPQTGEDEILRHVGC